MNDHNWGAFDVFVEVTLGVFLVAAGLLALALGEAAGVFASAYLVGAGLYMMGVLPPWLRRGGDDD